MKDANLSQVSELRIFAKSAMYYSKDMVHLCQKAIDEVREVYSAAEFWRNMVRRKVEEAQRQLDNAQKALNDYESQNHTDEEGNSTYDYHYASMLRSAVSEAEQHLISAKSDEDNVIARYQQVRQEAATVEGEMSNLAYSVSSAGDIAYQQITNASITIEQYVNI